jgi:hypothetical protein
VVIEKLRVDLPTITFLVVEEAAKIAGPRLIGRLGRTSFEEPSSCPMCF